MASALAGAVACRRPGCMVGVQNTSASVTLTPLILVKKFMNKSKSMGVGLQGGDAVSEGASMAVDLEGGRAVSISILVGIEVKGVQEVQERLRVDDRAVDRQERG